ncbi:MAG: BON domain-containing protein [Acidobacteriota bacterium]|nr:BON domain-containing protein [Blastocatellia bacterium]MDW8239137.1 BON domain-containing protein [Acidobacteriota bacterium]
MRLTLKGRLIIALLLLLLVGGGGIYLYSRLTGLTLSQIWERWTAPSAEEIVQQGSVESSDTSIEAQLYKALFSQADLRRQNVTTVVSGGVVTFSGEVESAELKAALDRLGQQIPGVKQVVNNTTVKSPSATSSTPPATPLPSATTLVDADEQLAKQVEFALYRTDAFELKYMVVTSRGGRIRLSGSVRSIAEKLLAERVAREVKGVTDVVNELTIEVSPQQGERRD